MRVRGVRRFPSASPETRVHTERRTALSKIIDWNALKKPDMRAAEDRLGLVDLRGWLLAEGARRPPNGLARELGVSLQTLYGWMRTLHLKTRLVIADADEETTSI